MVTRTKKVFVGGLSAQTTLDDVRAYFEQFGLVSSELFCSLETKQVVGEISLYLSNNNERSIFKYTHMKRKPISSLFDASTSN